MDASIFVINFSIPIIYKYVAALGVFNVCVTCVGGNIMIIRNIFTSFLKS